MREVLLREAGLRVIACGPSLAAQHGDGQNGIDRNGEE
jgi:hypothetical protein